MRGSLNCYVHVELAALVQCLMFAIFIAGMLDDRHAFCALIMGNWFVPFTSCLVKAISIVWKK